MAPKKAAAPKLRSTGSMKMMIDAAHVAAQQRKSVLRSLLLKWFSHAGRAARRCLAESEVELEAVVLMPLSAGAFEEAASSDMAAVAGDGLLQFPKEAHLMEGGGGQESEEEEADEEEEKEKEC